MNTMDIRMQLVDKTEKGIDGMVHSIFHNGNVVATIEKGFLAGRTGWNVYFENTKYQRTDLPVSTLLEGKRTIAIQIQKINNQ